ncbi:hypothetical protein Lal_00035270 [Lupinus albus]|nr:hypothetical protein Lal_00035270 [Lupinus albus]
MSRGTHGWKRKRSESECSELSFGSDAGCITTCERELAGSESEHSTKSEFATPSPTRFATFLEPKLATLLEPKFATLLEPKLATLLEPKLATLLEPKLATLLEPKLATLLEPKSLTNHVSVGFGFLATPQVPPTPPPTLGSFLIPPYNTRVLQPGSAEYRGLDEFYRRNPCQFHGGFAPDAVIEWVQGLERIFRAMSCSDAQKLVYATYMLV